MAITRYNPWVVPHANLQDELKGVFDRFFSTDDTDQSNVVTSQWTPRVDIKEEDKRFVILADIPGVDPKDIEVHMDGGIRSGQDVLKARALGAQGTLIGRSFLYGLGAYGEAGVTRALQIIQKELDITMAFCGHTNINNVDSSILLPGTYPTA